MHDNAFFESGMGCPIRSEIWGYVFPGAPDLAAKYAHFDGTLDHTGESVCPEQMFSAMAADAFLNSDLRRLAELNMHYLGPGLTVTKLIRAAFDAHDQGLTLQEARERILLLGGNPEPCDAMNSVPFTFLALLYGEYDLEKTILAALQCGYDTDCTLATAGAFIGQILGAKGLPKKLRDIIGDDLVMGIEYRRKDMTLSALARDTAKVGLKLARALDTGVEFIDAPGFRPYPKSLRRPKLQIAVDYRGAPAAAPGERVFVDLTVKNAAGLDGPAHIRIETPEDWQAVPTDVPVNFVQGAEVRTTVDLQALPTAKRWAQGHQFTAVLSKGGKTLHREPFGVAGAMVWRLLGVFFDPCERNEDGEITREMILKKQGMFTRHYYVPFGMEYIDEAAVAQTRTAAAELYNEMTRALGRPALVVCHDSFVDPRELIGLRGEWVCYLDAEFYSPSARELGLFLGSNDGYRLYFNGTMVKELDVQRWWTPGGWDVTVPVRKGRNRMLLELFKRGQDLRFSFGIREKCGTEEFPRRNDWATDLQWWNPLAL